MTLQRKNVLPALLVAAGVLVILAKQFAWAALVPALQTPDEQAHFAQLQYYAENRTLSLSGQNLSAELAAAEKLLGTYRDRFSNNRFTYHPQFNIPYTRGSEGKYEKEINSFAKSARTEYVGQEAAAYPPLYYVLDLPFYNLVYDHGLIDRIFVSRLLSVLLLIPLTLVAWQTGRVVWGGKIMPFALAAMVAFQPMISFVSAGIHPDNLLNFLYSLGILLLLLILKNGNRIRYLICLSVVVFLGLETKPLMFLFVPLSAAVFFWKTKLGRTRILLAAAALSAPVVIFFFQIKMPFVPTVSLNSPLASMTFVDYLRFRLPKMAFEVWPWYWGVFKWLGVTLPPNVLKIITRLGILGGLGILAKLTLAVKRRDFSFKTEALIFFLLSSIFYFLYLILWDWRLMQANGFSQGLQGRYFFPNIVGQMALLLAGLTVWRRFQKPLAVAAVFAMIALNLVALHTVAASYYDLSSLHVFLTQMAQYKPGLIKMFATM